MINNELRNALTNAAASTSGGTFDHAGRELTPTRGFAVGIKAFKTAERLAEFIAGRTKYAAGFWVDAETGRPYFDAVLIVRERGRALRLARRRGEIAVWDFANNSEVRI